MYYNTTHAKQPELRQRHNRSESQEYHVLGVSSIFPLFSPSQAHEYLVATGRISRKTPLQSIRRAITDLTNAGKLKRTEHKTEGLYGREEYLWTIGKEAA